jgi:glycine cleavage system H protein
MEGDVAIVGITDYAQGQLGDVVYVDLPEPEDELMQFEPFGEVESVKAVSDLFSPLSGRVIEANEALLERPELVNEDPYGQGWIIRVALQSEAEMEALLTDSEYEEFLATLEEEEL